MKYAFHNFFEDMKDNLKMVKFKRIDEQTKKSKWEQILKNLRLCQELEDLEIRDAISITNTTLIIIYILLLTKSKFLTKIRLCFFSVYCVKQWQMTNEACM